MASIDIGDDAVQALASIDGSTDDKGLEALGGAALAVILDSVKEDEALVGPVFEGMDVNFIKRIYSALVCVFLEAAKNDLSESEMLLFLRDECGLPEGRGAVIARVFAKRKGELRRVLSESANHSYLPQLENAEWKLEYCVPSSPEKGAVRELLYRVGLNVTDRKEGRKEKIEFIATLEELQELLSRMKDACKSVERNLDRR